MKRRGFRTLLLIVAVVTTLLLTGPRIPRVQAWGLATHMWLVDEGTANLPAGSWKTAFEFFATNVKSGSTTPDQAWQDWDNHLYYPDTASGSAPLAVERWYGFMRDNFSMGSWEEGMFAAGVMAHYYADINMPIHTGANWAGHGVLEGDINNHLGLFSLSVGVPQSVADPRQATIDAAVAAHTFYDDCVALYPNEVQPLPSPLEANATFRDVIETQMEQAVFGFRNLWWTATQGLEAPNIPGGAASWTILIDAGHNNVYTAPQDQLTAFKSQLAKWHASVVMNPDELTASDLVDVDVVVITPPRYNFTATEISVLADWVVNGTEGHLLVAAYSEHYRDPAYYPNPSDQFQRVNLEWLLGNCTSHVRLNDDSVYTTGTFQPWYVDLDQPLPGSKTFNITQGVATIRNYSPCSLWFTDATKVNVTAYGDPECYQSPDVVPPPAAVIWDDTNNGVGGDTVPLMAVEQSGDSRFFVSGTTFFSDFDYGATTFDNDVLVEHALEWLLNASLVELDVTGPAIAGVTVAPATPVLNQAINVTATVTDPSGVTNVTLTYQVNLTTPQTVLATPQGGGVYRAQVPALAVTPASNITYYLKAFDSLGNWRKTMPQTLHVAKLTWPTSPHFISLPASDNDGAFTVNWNASTDPEGIDHYQLQMSNTATFGTVLQQWNTSSLSVVTSGLSDGTYYFRVRAIDNQDLASPWSDTGSVVVTIPTPPPPPIPGFPWPAILLAGVLAVSLTLFRRRRAPAK